MLMRQVKGGSSGHSQSSLAVHFGLGSVTQADLVEVFWPAGGVVRWHGQPSGQRLHLVEGSACSGTPAASRCIETVAERRRPALR
ncbi:MAG: ASPIC/UnbV domain-containing protein [Spirochaetaceae bacterium]|nr:ASPIC/UnbV domain-containing protein [Spirochaetaceae bacterium]